MILSSKFFLILIQLVVLIFFISHLPFLLSSEKILSQTLYTLPDFSVLCVCYTGFFDS